MINYLAKIMIQIATCYVKIKKEDRVRNHNKIIKTHYCLKIMTFIIAQEENLDFLCKCLRKHLLNMRNIVTMKVKLLDIRRILTQITRKTMDKPILLIATGKDIDVVELHKRLKVVLAIVIKAIMSINKLLMNLNVIAEEIPIVSQTLKKITRKRTIILVRNYNLSD